MDKLAQLTKEYNHIAKIKIAFAENIEVATNRIFELEEIKDNANEGIKLCDRQMDKLKKEISEESKK